MRQEVCSVPVEKVFEFCIKNRIFSDWNFFQRLDTCNGSDCVDTCSFTYVIQKGMNHGSKPTI